jgi:uncharacterized protein (DUF4415 family)
MAIKIRRHEEAVPVKKSFDPLVRNPSPKPAPEKPVAKKAYETTMISIRLPNDVLEAYRSQGSGYQKRIIQILRETARKNGWL